MKNVKSTGNLTLSQNEKTGEMIVQYRSKRVTLDKAFLSEIIAEQETLAEYVAFYNVPNIQEHREEKKVSKYLKLVKDGNVERLDKEIQALQEARARLEQKPKQAV